jgi:uncharacterized caspase-like protein
MFLSELLGFGFQMARALAHALRFALALVMLGAPTAATAKSVALVIGIDAYHNIPKLQKAVNDARSVRGALTDLGFTVVAGENVTRRELNRRLADLEAAIAPGDTVFFFFAGHGIAIGAENFLLPADMPRPENGEEGLVRDEAFSVDNIIRRVQNRGALLSMFVLDACRDNPFEATGTRNIGGRRGLARADAPKGVFVLYSAGIGQTALDFLTPGDPDPNSIFTRKLVPLLRTPGLSHVMLAKRVQQEVDQLASTVRHAQQPAYYDQIVGEIVLRPGTAQVAAASTPPPLPASSSPLAARIEEERRQLEAIMAEETRRRERAEADAIAARLALRRVEEQQQARPAEPQPPPQPQLQPCPASFTNFRNTNQELSCQCAPSVITGAVWGTGVYTDDSSVCNAARHAGIIDHNGGTVRLRAIPGRGSYAGSVQNGVSSGRWDRWHGSFVFAGVDPNQIPDSGGESCPSNVRSVQGRLTCNCDSQNMSGTVWGSGTYTDDSSLCLAAVHAGIISFGGGPVTIVRTPGLGRYSGSSRNGVRTQSYGPWSGSFRFVQ